jgi:hypothetical protein
VAEEGALSGRVFGLKPDELMSVTVRAHLPSGDRAADAVMTFEYGSPFYALPAPLGTWNFTATGIDPAGKIFSFSPSGWKNPLTVTGSMQAINFAVDETTTSDLIGQVVYSDGVGIPGATVRVGGRKATTADDGRYVIHGLSSGTYPIIATKPGLRFRHGTAIVTEEDATASTLPALSGSPGNAAPIVVYATADPQPVSYRGTWLTVLGSDDQPADHLRYTWTPLFTPPGGSVTLEANGRDLNGTNSAQRLLAVFTKPGIYVFRVRAVDEHGAESLSAYVRVFVGT